MWESSEEVRKQREKNKAVQKTVKTKHYLLIRND